MNKGVELSGIITRLQSQLAHERQSTTALSMYMYFTMYEFSETNLKV